MNLPNEMTIEGVRYRRVDRQATRVSAHVMFDCHLFDQLEASSVDDVVKEWIAKNNDPEYTREPYGHSYLCPVIVLSDEKELRRVGPMVFPNRDDTDSKLGEWIRLCSADPDIPRLLAERGQLGKPGEQK